VSTIEGLLERQNSGSGVETKNAAVRIRRADYATPLYPQNLALTSPTGGSRSVGIAGSRTQVAEYFLAYNMYSRVEGYY
jgi:hypothetical protein